MTLLAPACRGQGVEPAPIAAVTHLIRRANRDRGDRCRNRSGIPLMVAHLAGDGPKSPGCHLARCDHRQPIAVGKFRPGPTQA